jgi:hypothetical protein
MILLALSWPAVGWEWRLASPAAARAATIHVSPDGPIASLHAARDAVRKLKARGPLTERCAWWWRKLDWLGFSSNSREATAYYLDNLRLTNTADAEP